MAESQITTSRNYRILSHSMLSSVLLLIVLILFNAMFARASIRVDLTEEGLYTLSDASERILSEMRDPVTVKVFWADVPNQFDAPKRYLRALLDEMRQVAGRKFLVEWVDMEDQEGKDEAERLNIEKFVFQASTERGIEQSEGYMSLVIESGAAEPKTLNALSNFRNQLEYLIISDLHKRTRIDSPVVGVVIADFSAAAGPGRGRFNEIQAKVRENFGNNARTFVPLDKPIDPDIDVLLVVAPWNLTEAQVFNLEQFVLRGGRMMLLLDPVNAKNVYGNPQERTPDSSGMEAWLAHVGVTAEYGLVGDFQATCLAPSSRGFHRYPYWPKVMPENMDRHNPVTQNLPPMPLYWPAALTKDDVKAEDTGRTITVLATTTEYGHRREEILDIAERISAPDASEFEQIPLMLLVEGPLSSFWKGKLAPGEEPPEPADGEAADGEPGDGEPGDGETPPKKADDAPKKDDEPKKEDDGGDAPKDDEPKKEDDGDAPKKDDEPKKEDDDAPKKDDDGDGEPDADEEPAGPKRLDEGTCRILIVGDAEMVADYFSPRRNQVGAVLQINGAIGFPFVENTLDWLTGSEDLLALRSRDTNPRNLEIGGSDVVEGGDGAEDEEEADVEGRIKVIKALNVTVVPVLLLLIGMVVFFVRRHGR